MVVQTCLPPDQWHRPAKRYTMTDAQTWRAMARGIIGRRRINPARRRSYWGDARLNGGLCLALESLLLSAGMPEDQYDRLRAQLRRAKPVWSPSDYWFPLNADGDADRAALCLRLAEACERRDRVRWWQRLDRWLWRQWWAPVNGRREPDVVPVDAMGCATITTTPMTPDHHTISVRVDNSQWSVVRVTDEYGNLI